MWGIVEEVSILIRQLVRGLLTRALPGRRAANMQQYGVPDCFEHSRVDAKARKAALCIA